MGHILTKIDNQDKLEEINLLKLENDNLKKKNESIEKCIELLRDELKELKNDYDNIIVSISKIIK